MTPRVGARLAGVVATVLWSIGSAACTGIIGDAGGTGTGGPRTIVLPDGAVVVVGDTDAGVIEATEQPCDVATAPLGPAPIRRLSRVEYLNSVRDLFPGVQLPTLTINADATIAGFDNNATAQGVTAGLVEQYQTAAEQVATAIAPQINTVLPCRPTTATEEPTCGRSFIASFVRRAYRRPLTAAETTRFANFFDAARSANGFAVAVQMVVRAVLQTPDFLYRPEFGSASTSDGAVALTPHELAARLSYFLWQSPPDATLAAAADANHLGTAEEIEAQVTRMLADPRAHASVAEFHRQWLGLDRLANATRDPALYPGFGAATVSALRASTSRFLEYAFWESDGTLRTLLTDRSAFVNDALAPIYGVAAPAGATLTRVALDSRQRAGLLTQAGMLTMLGHTSSSAPVLRGVFVLDRLLCAPSPPPPPGVNNSPLGTSGTPRTTRERYAAHVASTACSGCHTRIDGVGFGLENYDAIGRYRTMENALPVDASGEVLGTLDADGSFDGAVALAERLAGSRQVERCVATQWFRFGLGRSESVGDACAIRTAAEGAGGNMRDLLVRIATSRAFRNRPPVGP